MSEDSPKYNAKSSRNRDEALRNLLTGDAADPMFRHKVYGFIGHLISVQPFRGSWHLTVAKVDRNSTTIITDVETAWEKL